MAKSYANQKVLFISDIRTADYRQMDHKENENFIVRDNETQIKWIQIMNPIKSMLKFRHLNKYINIEQKRSRIQHKSNGP